MTTVNSQDLLIASSHKLPLTVVIATLGGPCLTETLERLNTWEVLPDEILVCIPEEENLKRSISFQYQNTRVIETPCRGQVQQRAFGLKLAKQRLVLQMDDDILLDNDAFKRLLEEMSRLGPGNAVSPLYCHKQTNKHITRHPSGFKGGLFSLYVFLLYGAPWGFRRMGKLTRSGVGFWVDRDLISDKPYETEWLPGGCVLCHREDLVLEDYYPLKGKAFAEDLIHSILWRRNGVRLWAIPDALCATTVDIESLSWCQTRSRFLAHAHLVRLMDGAMLRLYIWFLFTCVARVARIVIASALRIGKNWKTFLTHGG